MTPRKLRLVMFRSLWAYRAFVAESVRREFQTRYRGSLLGIGWAVIQPLAQIMVFTLVFSQLMRPRLPGHEGDAFAYSVYLCAGLLPWTLFSEVLTRLNGVFVEHADLMKKASFPRIALPVVAIASSLVNFAIMSALFLGFLLLVGRFPSIEWLALIPVLVVELAFAAGLGLLLGTLNVFFRDIGPMTTVVLSFWFWLTPIVYVVDALPAQVARLVSFNPMTPIVAAYQRIIVESQWPDFVAIAPVALAAVVLVLCAGVFFVRQSAELVDEL